jgi:hypothetical protein
MTLWQKILRLYGATHSLLAHKTPIPRAKAYAVGAAVLGLCGLLWAAQRELKSSLAWAESAGSPKILARVQAEGKGQIIYVDRPSTVPCPTRILQPTGAAGTKALEGLGVHLDRQAALATWTVAAAPYGVQGATTIDKQTGAVENTAVVANPLAAADNRWAFYAGAVRDAKLGTGAELGLTWDPISFRLPRTAFRAFARVGADGLVFSGHAEGRLFAGIVVRRP